MERVLITIIVVFALILVMTGCSPKVTEGTVVNKSYEATHVDLIPIFYTVGEVTTVSWVPVSSPDKWSVEVVDRDKNTEWWEIDSKTYSSINIGDHIKK